RSAGGTFSASSNAIRMAGEMHHGGIHHRGTEGTEKRGRGIHHGGTEGTEAGVGKGTTETQRAQRQSPTLCPVAAGGETVRLKGKSRMRRESHVRFCESGGVRFPSATRPVWERRTGGRNVT